MKTILDLSSDGLRVLMIFFPYMTEKTITAIQGDQQFVHYSDGNAALSMIQNKEVWLRNTTWMNDVSEIRYGIELLISAYNNIDGQRLQKRVEDEWPGFCAEFERIFSSWIEDWRQETYVACLTEKLPKEDQIGRLSMWRAYGQSGTPIACVVNGGPFLRLSDALGAYTSPVGYFDQEEFHAQFKRVVDNVLDNFDFLKQFGRDHTFSNLFAAFRYAIICTKHPSFYEEREWRIVYQPTYQLPDHKRDRVLEDTKVIRGAPQRIFKIPMKDYPEEGFYGATLPDLLARVIIGPGPDAANLHREFTRFLTRENIPDAASKVIVSNVPLRV